MKTSTIQDKEWFFIGAALSGNKNVFVPNNTGTYYEKSNTVPSSTANVYVNEQNRYSSTIENISIPTLSDLGKLSADLARQVLLSVPAYSQTKRLQHGFYDCSSLVSRIYHQLIPDDTSFAKGPNDVFSQATFACNTDLLAKKFIRDASIISINCIDSHIIEPGDIILYANNMTNTHILHVSHAAIYVGNNKMIEAYSTNRGIIESNVRIDGVELVARPALAVNGQIGLTIPDDVLENQIFDTANGKVTVKIIQDSYVKKISNT